MWKFLNSLTITLLVLAEVLLAARFVFKFLIGASSIQIITSIYQLTQPLVQPFAVVFPTPSIKSGSIFEFATVFAFFVLAFVGYVLSQIFKLLDAVQVAHQNTNSRDNLG
jgi:YggT family protein